MKNYEDLLLERVQNLTGKLAQKQREGSLAEELGLCVRLAQLHAQLGALNVSLQFWQSCFQIAADLADEEEEWRAVSEIAKIYCKSGQVDTAESFMKEHLCSKLPVTPLRLSLLQAEVIEAIGNYYSSHDRNGDRNKLFHSVNEFLAYERALQALDEAFGLATPQNVWWWDAIAFRAELLLKLGKFDDSRYSEAIDTLQTVQINGNVLMSLRTKSISAQIYFEMDEFQTALDFAISVIDEYTADPQNSNYRPRRQFYCEMLFLAGRALKTQKDFNFSLDNLLLAKDEAQSLTAEREFMEAIDRATQETLAAKEASIEASKMARRKEPTPKDLEELAGLFGLIGDFNGQCDLLEQCRAVATSETSKRRLDRKLLNLYSTNLNKWQEIERRFFGDDLLFQDWNNLMIKAKTFEKVGKFDEAEGCLLMALNEARGGDREGEMICNAALFFLNLQRGRISAASKFGEEAQSLETILTLPAAAKNKTTSVSIDPNFSYFATRKPSNSLMKMVGSGMVMRTKTKKTSGLQLKRRRGPSKLGLNAPRRREAAASENGHSNGHAYTDDTDDEDDEGALSDFIVNSSGDEEEEPVESDSDTKILTAKSPKLSNSLLIISSDDEEPRHYHHHGHRGNTGIAQDSPLMIRTVSLSDPFSPPTASPVKKIDFYEKPTTQQTNIGKVIVRIKKGVDVLVPVSSRCTVAELIKSAQTRFERLFPSDASQCQLGRISGLSLSSPSSNSPNAMLFHEDCVSSVLSADLEILQAHFSNDNNSNKNNSASAESPSKFSSIEEEFRRKFQILNLKKDCQDEISWLKTLQERFNTAKNGRLDFSALSMDSMRLSDNSLLTGKLVKLATAGNLCLRENLLVDDDLKAVFSVAKEVSRLDLDLSLNFLRKPAALKSINPESIDLSYNPLDFDWVISNVASIAKSSVNLIGCFFNGNCNWSGLGKSLRFLKKLEISLPPCPESQISFLTGLCEPCGDAARIEELSLFAVDFCSDSEEALVELSYIETLKSLKFDCCSFKNAAIAAICKILRRSTALERLEFTGNDVEAGEDDPLMLQSFEIVEM